MNKNHRFVEKYRPKIAQNAAEIKQKTTFVPQKITYEFSSGIKVYKRPRMG
jgi:hypothetical protein